MVHRKKSSKLIPILFFILIIFLVVLVVNNYLTYQAFQESERQYQDFQQQLIIDAMNKEVVEEVVEEPFSSLHYNAEDNTFALLSFENPVIDLENELLTFDVIQYEHITGPYEVYLNNGVLRTGFIEEDTHPFQSEGMEPVSYGVINPLYFKDACLEGCDSALERSSKYEKVVNNIVVNLSHTIESYVGVYWTGINTPVLRYLKEVERTQAEVNQGLIVYEDINDESVRESFSQTLHDQYLTSGTLVPCKSFTIWDWETEQEINPGERDSVSFELSVESAGGVGFGNFEYYETANNNHRVIYPAHDVDYFPVFTARQIINLRGTVCGQYYEIRDKYLPPYAPFQP
jgi:hypothetical protein